MSQFEAKYDEFQAMGAEIVGISVDSHFSHAAFAQKLGLRYPLLSDFDREVCGDYVGYFDEVAGYRGVNRRAIVVLAPSGMVSRTWVASKPADVPDTEMVREAVQDVVQGDDG